MNILFIFTIICSTIHTYSRADNTNYTHITPTYYCSTPDNSSNNNSQFFANQNLLSVDFLSRNQSHWFPASPGLESMSTGQLQAYFAAQKLSEDEILSQQQLYMSNAYIALVKNYVAYPAYIKKYHQKYLKYGALRKCWSWIKGTYTSGMARRFRELHQDLVRKEAAQQLLSKQQEVHRGYHGQLKKIESELIAKSVNMPYAQARREALHATYLNDARVQRKILVAEDIQYFAREYEIEPSMLEQGFMNPYEYQLHTEFIDQLSAVVQLQSISDRCHEYQVFLDAVGYGVSLGIEANHDHDAVAATHWADYAWNMLDIAKAVGEGIALGCYNVAMIPVQVASGAMYCATHLTESLKALTYFFSCDYHVDMIRSCLKGL